MPRKSGTSGSVGGRRKRTWSQAPRWRPPNGSSGAEGGPGKRASRNAGTAPRSDPYTHWTRAGVASVAILDIVSRKWIGTLTSPEETSTQIEVAFLAALEAEGLLELAPSTFPLPLPDVQGRLELERRGVG